MTRIFLTVALLSLVGCAVDAEPRDGFTDDLTLSEDQGTTPGDDSQAQVFEDLELWWSVAGEADYHEGEVYYEVAEVDGSAVEAWACQDDGYGSAFRAVVDGAADPADVCEPHGFACLDDDCSEAELEWTYRYDGYRNVVLFE